MQRLGRTLLSAFVASAATAAAIIVVAVSAATRPIDVIALLSRALGHPGALGTGWIVYFTLAIGAGSLLFDLSSRIVPQLATAMGGTLLGAGSGLLYALSVPGTGGRLDATLLVLFIVYGLVFGSTYTHLDRLPRRLQLPA